MLTRWGRALDREHPLPEYPRPQLVRGAWVNLNGVWEHAFTDSPDRPSSYDGPIVVPFSPEAELSGVGRQLQPDEWLWYRRSFTAPAPPPGGRVLLHFGAVDQTCTVWVNGEEVGGHTGGYLPFTLDVTDQVQTENLLEVRVRDLSETGVHARGKQRLDRGKIWYTAQSGIWQTVWLEAVPASYVERLVLTPHLDAGELEVTVVAAGEPVADPAHVVVSTGSTRVGEASVPTGVPVRIPLSEVHPWSPEDPLLYDVEVTLGEDRVTSYAALRSFGTGRDEHGHARLLLNGEPVDARRRARPGVLARRTAHPAQRRGDGPRHRDDEVARLHDAAQARQARAAALVCALRPPRHARLAGRRQRRGALPRADHHPPGAAPGVDPRPPARALRAAGRRRSRGVPPGAARDRGAAAQHRVGRGVDSLQRGLGPVRRQRDRALDRRRRPDAAGQPGQRVGRPGRRRPAQLPRLPAAVPRCHGRDGGCARGAATGGWWR